MVIYCSRQNETSCARFLVFSHLSKILLKSLLDMLGKLTDAMHANSTMKDGSEFIKTKMYF